jgi:hypothetical protein
VLCDFPTSTRLQDSNLFTSTHQYVKYSKKEALLCADIQYALIDLLLLACQPTSKAAIESSQQRATASQLSPRFLLTVRMRRQEDIAGNSSHEPGGISKLPAELLVEVWFPVSIYRWP